MAVKQASAKLTANNWSTSRTFSNPLPANTTAGSTLLFYCVNYASNNAPFSAVTIGGQAAVRDQLESLFADAYIEVWRVQSAAGGNRGNVVITSGAGQYTTGHLLEIDQLAANPVDRINDGVTYGNAISATTGVATSQDDELVIAIRMAGYGVSNIGGSTPATTGYTSGFVEQVSNVGQGGEGSYKFVDTAGVQTADWTKTDSAGQYTLWSIITYRLADEGTPTGIVGTLNAALNPSTLAASGRLAIEGSGASTLQPSTLAATGVLSIKGNAVATLQASTLQATGGFGITATLIATLQPSTLDASGKLAIAAAATTTLQPSSLQATGALAIRATAAATLQPSTLSAAGRLPIIGVGAATLQPSALSAAGGFGLSGALFCTLQPSTLAANGRLEIKAALSATLQPSTLAATGEGDSNTGSVNATLQPSTLQAQGRLAIVGALNVTLRPSVLVAVGDLEGDPVITPQRAFKFSIPESVNTFAVDGRPSTFIIP